jgi:hypothetical protein
MVDSELRRPAAARIEAHFRRVADHVRGYGSLTNLSGATLAYANPASTAATISSALTPGWQTGEIEFSASSSDGPALTQVLPVRAYYGPLWRVFWPVRALTKSIDA